VTGIAVSASYQVTVVNCLTRTSTKGKQLILIGGAQDVVIESGLSNGAEELREPLRPPIPLRPAPRAPVFAERRPTLQPVEPPMMS
jgi:hypothetical protein